MVSLSLVYFNHSFNHEAYTIAISSSPKPHFFRQAIKHWVYNKKKKKKGNPGMIATA